ncbi:MAG: M23 family metallopeptidase [bacterium]|nr:M23 family metallopeptidase [bacterium]
MVLGIRIGGLAVAAAIAWLSLHPGQPTPESLVPKAQQEESERSPLAYLPPVDAEVVDSFRAPAHVGAPGNRGLEYEPAPGQPVRASAEGEVVFAGSVARNRFVTVMHGDGLRTSYGYLGWIAVAKGDWVGAGQLLGTTSKRFFFSVRTGDTYLDPALVLSAGKVRLVPHREPDSRSRLPAYG